jgi:S-DNA-T family DNA segregation ATPase FtsK/SpoIIIE
MGGRTFTAAISQDGQQMVPVGPVVKPASGAPAPQTTASPASAHATTADGPRPNGIMGRLRSVAPAIGAATVGAAAAAAKVTAEALDASDKPADAMTTPAASRFGGLGGKLFNRSGQAAADVAGGTTSAGAAARTGDAPAASAPTQPVNESTAQAPATAPPPAEAAPGPPAVARLGELARGVDSSPKPASAAPPAAKSPSSETGSPAATASASSATARPPVIEPAERPADRSVSPAPPPSSSAFASRPVVSPDPFDDEVDDAPEEEDWSKLPPARPRSPMSPPSSTSRPASANDSIPDLQSRMEALRSLGTPAPRPSPAADAAKPAPDKIDADKPAEADKPSTVAGAAGAIAIGAAGAAAGAARSVFDSLTGARKDEVASPAKRTPDAPPSVTLPKAPPVTPSSAFGKPDDGIRDPDGTMASSRPTGVPSPRPFGAVPPAKAASEPAAPLPPTASPRAESSDSSAAARKPRKDWRLPEMTELLSTGLDQELDRSALVKRARIIEDTLSSFGAPGRVVEVRTGPVITQFGVEPDYVEGRGGKKGRVKVSAIAALDKDLQLALGAKSIRIEAPVPGKGYVGIEVPNEKPAVVKLRDVLESSEYRRIPSPLAIALGQSVDGTPVAADLASMPHLLIAGTTGSGKSVCVNTIIASLLIRNAPERLKLIMVDPKRVELTGYNGIPHLIAPVVVELERIVSVLKWVTREMDERYRKFALAGARNIEDFNKHLPNGEPTMPYIVVIIDELADLMMLAPDETEKVITRLAALARATGIHLVIATQRPSVDVVTGLIKANFPARIAFAVAGGVDSRVILDQPGAERLLGRGDMLYMSGDAPAPVRLQGVYMTDTEINNITRFWRSQMTDADLAQAGKPLISQFMMDEAANRDKARDAATKSWAPGGSQPSRPSAAAFSEASDYDDDGSNADEDELYEQAVDLVRRNNKASTSLLQRRFRIGYTRAARLMDLLEERGVVGPPVDGAKPREVLPPKR